MMDLLCDVVATNEFGQYLRAKQRHSELEILAAPRLAIELSKRSVEVHRQEIRKFLGFKQNDGITQ